MVLDFLSDIVPNIVYKKIAAAFSCYLVSLKQNLDLFLLNLGTSNQSKKV